jgi:hypothetical protein
VYEDCRRDCEVQIGTKLLEDLAQPLGVVLDATRWALAAVSSVMSEQIRICLRELLEIKDERQDSIDSHLFVEYVSSKLYGEQHRHRAFGAVLKEFQEMWKQVLGRPVQSSSARAMYSAQEARERAATTFPAREIGFSLARYVSPDIMIAASSIEAFCRGEYAGVLGEVHCENTVASSCFASQHSDPQALSQAVSADTLHETIVTQLTPASVWLIRTNNVLVQPNHWRYQFGDEPPHHPLCRPLPGGMLRVAEASSSVVVHAIDGSVRFDALELFGTRIVDEAELLLAEFLPPAAHMPRISLGKMVIAREQWNITPKEMPFLRTKDPTRQFLEIRVWRRSCGMPRRVFAKSPAERKPWFLDFDSPVFIAIFVSLMRKLPDDASVRLTEMFPDTTDLWLADRNGQLFTGELRLVARAASDYSK